MHSIVNPKSLLLSIGIACLTFWFVSCGQPKRLPTETALDEKVLLMREVDKLYREYVTGDAQHARESLIEAIKRIEPCSQLDESERAVLLLLHFSRAAVLESKEGEAGLAQAYLFKARYWKMRDLELSSTSILKAFESVESYDLPKAKEMVERMDVNLNDGRTANYNEGSGRPRAH